VCHRLSVLIIVLCLCVRACFMISLRGCCLAALRIISMPTNCVHPSKNNISRGRKKTIAFWAALQGLINFSWADGTLPRTFWAHPQFHTLLLYTYSWQYLFVSWRKKKAIMCRSCRLAEFRHRSMIPNLSAVPAVLLTYSISAFLPVLFYILSDDNNNLPPFSPCRTFLFC